ncbi:MAG: hypothetical protein JWO07_82 [Candidatus Saccharibacteria bacterium]|nr:hypothetical protein [Candidatus Saccharibacteria bacterium]
MYMSDNNYPVVAGYLFAERCCYSVGAGSAGGSVGSVGVSTGFVLPPIGVDAPGGVDGSVVVEVSVDGAVVSVGTEADVAGVLVVDVDLFAVLVVCTCGCAVLLVATAGVAESSLGCDVDVI